MSRDASQGIVQPVYDRFEPVMGVRRGSGRPADEPGAPALVETHWWNRPSIANNPLLAEVRGYLNDAVRLGHETLTVRTLDHGRRKLYTQNGSGAGLVTEITDRQFRALLKAWPAYSGRESGYVYEGPLL